MQKGDANTGLDGNDIVKQQQQAQRVREAKTLKEDLKNLENLVEDVSAGHFANKLLRE